MAAVPVDVNIASTSKVQILTRPLWTLDANDFTLDNNSDYTLDGDFSYTEYELEGYRFRNDDGSESAATWKETQDTTTSIQVSGVIRLRTLLNTSGSADTAQIKLQYKKDSEPGTAWRDV